MSQISAVDPATATIPGLVARARAEFGDDEALSDGEVRWTFGDLADRVIEAARGLIASGVAPGDRVGLWAPNIREWVVAALAVHSVGGLLVPVNTRFKADEAAYVLRRGGVRLVFTVTDFLDADYVGMLREGSAIDTLEEIVVLRGPVPAGAMSFGDLLACGAAVDEGEAVARAAAVSPRDACHILFTSGTTGQPKGAVLEHGAVCRAYFAYNEAIGLRRGDRYLIVLPFFHSFGLHAGILSCLMAGATILPEQVFDPLAIVERIRADKVTCFPGPPAVYQGILNIGASGDHDLSTLRLAVVSAASIPVQLITDMRDRLGIERVVTGYGLTEASGIVTMCHHTDAPEVIATTVGRPLAGLELRVLDADGRDVEPGTPGEIVVRGYTLMREYLDDPGATASAVDGQGWLHTGDIGYVRPDGNVVITDRKKDMFIVGGFNVYPAEIESIMLRHPAIAQVAVVGVPDDRLGEVGMAFVVPADGSTLDPAAIVEWCRGAMANFKVPRQVRVVAELPTNATGKVIKDELRALAAVQP